MHKKNWIEVDSLKFPCFALEGDFGFGLLWQPGGMFAFGKHTIIVTGSFFNFFHSSFLLKKNLMPLPWVWAVRAGWWRGGAPCLVPRRRNSVVGRTPARLHTPVPSGLVDLQSEQSADSSLPPWSVSVRTGGTCDNCNQVKNLAVRNRDLVYRVFLSASGLKSSPQVVVRSVEGLGWPRWPPLPLKGCTLHMSSIASYVELINRYHQLMWKWATPKKSSHSLQLFHLNMTTFIEPFLWKVIKT